MKTLLLVLLAVSVAWFGWQRAAPAKGTVHSIPQTERPAPPPPTRTVSDATEVFQRAFWQRPSNADQILHAERREWAEAEGIKSWQWFIIVKPSPELLKRLRQDNVFNLTTGTPAAVSGEEPEWFHFDPAEVEMLISNNGTMQLAFHRSGNVLYATDSGGGFRPGKPSPSATESSRSPVTGRLPPGPPPRP